MQQPDYNFQSYYQYPSNSNPNPNLNSNPSDHHQRQLPPSVYASAPPFAGNYPPPDPSSSSSFYSSSYSVYPQTSAPAPINPPSAPSPYPPSAPSSYPPSSPNLQSFPPSTHPQTPSFPSFESHGSYQPMAQQQSCYRHEPPVNFAPSSPVPSAVNPTPSPPMPSNVYSSQYNQLGSSFPPVCENPYESNVKLDYTGAYLDEQSGRYGASNHSASHFGGDLYGKRPDSGMSKYDSGSLGNDGYSDGVYAYQGKVEPYGARGTAPKSSTWSSFDDFGRPIGAYSSGKERLNSPKIARAIPKAETQQDSKSGGVQKFRVKLLAESGGPDNIHVLCQIGLDGIRMLDPTTNRILRIYPLDTITRCEVIDPSTFAFWSKSSVDIEPRRIRLQSSSYTTNTLLDTVTAATFQFKEIGGRSRPSESPKIAEQPTEKKKGFADWMNVIKPVIEEKDHWVPDEAVTKCTACGTDFSAFVRKHHCRNCGDIFCDKCTHGRVALTADENALQVRVCDGCMAEVARRLNIAKETGSKSSELQSHEHLAKKLQEEMEKNRRTSSGSRTESSGRRMKEVACPTCTVHLQVQVPTSGSETIECGVCQHPFLVSSN